VILVGLTWSCFLGAMMTQGVDTAPLAERVLKAGAVGYGWLNAAWGVGAFVSALYLPKLIRELHPRACVAWAMGILSAGIFVGPFVPVLALSVGVYFIMG